MYHIIVGEDEGLGRFRRGLVVSVLLLLFVALFCAILNVSVVRGSGTIYIRADGSIDPADAPISTLDNVTYTLTDDIYDSIMVERSNIIIDGAGFTLQGSGISDPNYTGLTLLHVNNVTLKELKIKRFYIGVYLTSSSNNTITHNVVTDNGKVGVQLSESSGNTIENSSIIDNAVGIWEGWGIALRLYCKENIIISNNIVNNGWVGSGIYLYYESSDNIITENYIADHGYSGVNLDKAQNNIFYHNNFVNNAYQVASYMSWSTWDDGYPSGGNYWSDYAGVDEKSGPSQDEPDSDGIGDTPYDVDEGQDCYPLMHPWIEHELEVTLKAPTFLLFGNSTTIEATVSNWGAYDETNITFSLFINNTSASSTTITLLQIRKSHTISYFWTPITEGLANVTAYAEVVSGETNVTNNRKTVFVTISSTMPPVLNMNTGLYYNTIQEAIDASEALNGHIIYVKTGTYYEHVTVSKSLTLVGENPDSTIIDGNKTGNVIAIMVDNVTISNFTVQHGGMWPEFASGIRLYDATNCTITRNNIRETGAGVKLDNSPYNTIFNNNMTGNNEGVCLVSSPYNTITGNTIANNYHGIIIESSYNMVFCNNITENTDAGIFLGWSSGNSVYGNNIISNANGISLCNSWYSSIYGNSIISNGKGIYLFPESWDWAGNYYGPSNYNNISVNDIENNGYGVYLEYSLGNSIYHNNFIGNMYQTGIPTSGFANIWDNSYPSGGNYWSDCYGPDLCSGPYQNETGSDGIRDAQYIVDVDNRDGYPLLNPMGSLQLPIAIFTCIPEHPLKDETVTFNATSSHDRDGNITAYRWNFGDGNITTVTGPIITHIFSAQNNYTVNLRVTDDDGLSHWATKSVIVTVDLTPPTIGIPSREPEGNIQPNQPVTVSVNVTDVIGYVKNVTLYYSLNNGTTWEEPLPMNLDPLTSSYQATIPGQEAGTWVRFKIIAYDYAGNNATLDGTEPYCVYQVIPEFPSSLILLIPVMGTLLATIIHKRKQPRKVQPIFS